MRFRVDIDGRMRAVDGHAPRLNSLHYFSLRAFTSAARCLFCQLRIRGADILQPQKHI